MAFYYILRIQISLQYAIRDILGFLNGFVSNIFKYSNVYINLKKEALTMSEEKKIELTQELKEAFTYFYEKVKEYYKKRDYGTTVNYADIGDYITGYLSIGGSFDKEWLLNEQDLGGYDEDVLSQLIVYCQKKAIASVGKAQQDIIPDDEPLLSL